MYLVVGCDYEVLYCGFGVGGFVVVVGEEFDGGDVGVGVGDLVCY